MLLRDAPRGGVGEAVLEKGDDVVDDVDVPRCVLHRPRRALHVHEAEVGGVMGDRLGHLGVAAQRGHVVDELGAELESSTRHDGLGRVDRDRCS